LAEKTQLAPDAFKLIHAGAVMKDDNATLSSYNIKPNATLALIPIAAPPQRTDQQRPTEQATRARIAAERDLLRNSLAQDIAAFVPSPQEHARLAELLLQSLLRLDAIVPEPAWADAREERRQAVKEVQEALDALDHAWRASGAVD
jgi:hypothetical protein